LLYSTGVRGEGNIITVADAPDTGEEELTIRVQSERGIGEGTIAWWGNQVPHHLSFHLHLNALEHFHLRWGKRSITVSVASSGNFVLESMQVGHQGEVEITPESPYWIEVTMPSGEHPYFELRAPAAFLNDSPRLFAISWIDYYR
jgi:hypothetical protein